MDFTYTTAYIGPYCVSLARGKSGQVQRFRFPVPFSSVEEVSQGLLVTEGRILLSWSIGPEYDAVMGPGGSFVLDSVGHPMSVNEELAHEALEDCSFLCVSAVGIEQRVDLMRYWLKTGEKVLIERYSLVAITGSDSLISVNGRSPQRGARLFYARSTELEITAHSDVVVGRFAFPA
jgi:hypothetical protein